jgi:hypothetical protein
VSFEKIATLKSHPPGTSHMYSKSKIYTRATTAVNTSIEFDELYGMRHYQPTVDPGQTGDNLIILEYGATIKDTLTVLKDALIAVGE